MTRLDPSGDGDFFSTKFLAFSMKQFSREFSALPESLKQEILGLLRPRERTIMLLSGLDGNERAQREIGNEVGLKEGRIKQIQDRAVAKIQSMIERRRAKPDKTIILPRKARQFTLLADAPQAEEETRTAEEKSTTH